MGCRECPKCQRPKACDDEFCIVCELKEAAVEKIKRATDKITRKGVRSDKGQ